MACNKKLHGPKVKKRGRKILLAQIFYSTRFFYPSGNGGTIVGGNGKLFDNDFVWSSKLMLEEDTARLNAHYK